MASVDKTSVRNEVSRVKAEFVQLCDKGNVSSEVKLLMNSMFMIIELMLSIFFWFPRSCVVTHTEQGNIHAAEYGTLLLSSVVTFIDMHSHAERGNEGEIILLKTKLFIKMMRMV